MYIFNKTFVVDGFGRCILIGERKAIKNELYSVNVNVNTENWIFKVKLNIENFLQNKSIFNV